MLAPSNSNDKVISVRFFQSPWPSRAGQVVIAALYYGSEGAAPDIKRDQ